MKKYFIIILTTLLLSAGISVKVTKVIKSKRVYRAYFENKYSQKLKKMTLKDANIFIKQTLIEAYKKMGLKSYEISKYHIFIKPKDLEKFKKGYILWIKLKYKAKAYTNVYIKIS